MGRLEGKVALVTGAGSGIGAATARRFAQEGAIVAVNDMNEANGEKVAAEINQAGGQATFYLGSVSDSGIVSKMIKDIATKNGRLDILVNNAGIIRDAMSYKMTEDQWDIVLNVHLKGSWLCARTAYEYMKEQGNGAITNTSSTSSLGNIGQANYASAKAGIWGLTKTLALEYARFNIRCNAIAPGYIETPMTAQIPAQLQDLAINNIPLKRKAQPEEVAALHLFLASDEASYITGQIIFIDGGTSTGT